jgi:hypothetical protein
MELNEREIEVIDGMIEVQLNHANRCNTIANRYMAEKQKGWDLERVALLEKIKSTRATDPLLEEMARALKRVSEDGHALMSMTIGSRNAVIEALQKYPDRGE